MKNKIFLEKAFVNYSRKTKKKIVFTLYVRNSDGLY